MTTATAPTDARVLIVDDHIDGAELLQELLDLEGHPAEVVGDGSSALQRCAGATWKAVLIDLQLPDMTGVELADRLRAAPTQDPQPLLIAITGHDRGEARARGVTDQFDHFLQKPVDVDQLIGLLSGEEGKP